MLSPEDLAEITSAVTERLREEIQTAIDKAMSPDLDRARAAAYLGVSEAWIDQQKRRGKLKPSYLGDKPVYKRTDLDALKTNKKT